MSAATTIQAFFDLPSIQVNVRAEQLPPPVEYSAAYLHIPLSARLKHKAPAQGPSTGPGA